MNAASLDAVIRLHGDAPRQGPGEGATLDRMIDRLRMQDGARAADLGCGAGATALRLALTRGWRRIRPGAGRSRQPWATWRRRLWRPARWT